MEEKHTKRNFFCFTMTWGQLWSCSAFMSWLSFPTFTHRSKLLNNLNSNCVLWRSTGLKLQSNWSLKHQLRREVAVLVVRNSTYIESKWAIQINENVPILFLFYLFYSRPWSQSTILWVQISKGQPLPQSIFSEEKKNQIRILESIKKVFTRKWQKTGRLFRQSFKSLI